MPPQSASVVQYWESASPRAVEGGRGRQGRHRGTASAQPSYGPPPGCTSGLGAVAAFDKAWEAATTQGSRISAAQLGYNGTMSASVDATEPVSTQDSVLAQDFSQLIFHLEADEPVTDDLSGIQADTKTLEADCYGS